MFASGGLSLSFGHHPVLDSNAFAGVGIGPARDISCRKHSGHARFEVLVDSDAAVDGESRLLGERRRRGRTPMPTTIRSASSDVPPVRATERPSIERHRVAEMKDDTMAFVDGADEIAKVCAQDLFHRARIRRNDVDLQSARSQRGRDFQTDEAGTDHDGSFRCRRAP